MATAADLFSIFTFIYAGVGQIGGVFTGRHSRLLGLP
jgi:hypothetical protein